MSASTTVISGGSSRDGVRGRSEGEQVERKQALSSVLKALDLIDELAAAGRPLTLKELSARVGRPAPSTHRLLRTLELRDYVENVDGRYRLTLKMYGIGSSIVSGIDIVTEARPICRRLCDEVQETVNLAIRSGMFAVYVAKIECPRSLRLFTQLGLHVPLHCTALGKALVMFEEPTERERLLQEMDFAPRAENTITSRADFEREIELTRARGYAIDNEELDRGLVCISSPVFNQSGQVQLAMSIAGPPARLPQDAWDDLGRAVRRAADEVSALVGYTS